MEASKCYSVLGVRRCVTRSLFVWAGMLSLFFSSSAYAVSEIGEPVRPKHEKGRYVDAAFLAPDNQHFYSLQEGMLRKYSIDSLSLVTSQEIEFKAIQKKNDNFKVFMTSDENRLIIVLEHKREILLLDLVDGRIVKKIKIKDRKFQADFDNDHTMETHKSHMEDATLNGDEFVVAMTGSLIIFNALDLTQIREVPMDWMAYLYFGSIHKILDYMVYIDSRGVGLIDPVTYKSKRLYFHRTDYHAYLNMDLQGLDKSVVHNDVYCGVSFISKCLEKHKMIFIGRYPVYISRHFSIISGGRSYKLANHKTLQSFEIIQKEDGELILFDNASKQFRLTSNARQYLKMKNAQGELVPINTATFEEFTLK